MCGMSIAVDRSFGSPTPTTSTRSLPWLWTALGGGSSLDLGQETLRYTNSEDTLAIDMIAG